MMETEFNLSTTVGNLSIGEFLRILNIYKTEKAVPESDIADLTWVSKETGYAKNSIYHMISSGKIPTVSRNKPLRFSKKAIRTWAEQGFPTNAQTNINNAIKRKNK